MSTQRVETTLGLSRQPITICPTRTFRHTAGPSYPIRQGIAVRQSDCNEAQVRYCRFATISLTIERGVHSRRRTSFSSSTRAAFPVHDLARLAGSTRATHVLAWLYARKHDSQNRSEHDVIIRRVHCLQWRSGRENVVDVVEGTLC